ncbi:hypothetical protein NX059_011333 [Plenodomus lindquistii]|nr:hypothetical protein NX059_011333 [Plenodomus lindquistii]
MPYTSSADTNAWNDSSPTPIRTKQTTTENFEAPHTPDVFMPQAPNPMMVPSSATRSMSRSNSDRALRLAQSPAFARDLIDTVGAFSGDEDKEGNRDSAPIRTGININSTRVAPPLTPSIDTSLTPKYGARTAGFFARIHCSPRQTTTTSPARLYVLVAMGVAVAALAGLAIYGNFRAELVHILTHLWSGVVIASGVLEVGVKGMGFLCGRAIAGFVDGFAKGLQL